MSTQRGERNPLHLGALESKGLELRGHIGGRDQLVMGAAAASAQCAGGEKAHLAMHAGKQGRALRSSRRVLREDGRRKEQKSGKQKSGEHG